MSAQKFVISDLHLGHTNMAIKRGFSSVEEHDETIIEKWNSVVRKGDTVWVLGDLTMEKATVYPKLSSLNGYIKVVGGNHDTPNHSKKMLEYVNGICGVYGMGEFVLSHVPVHPSMLTTPERWRYNIHGHMHEETVGDPRYVNVSCEKVDYMPVTFDLIKYALTGGL